jgi:DNA-binding NtrC family response regulator
VAELVGAGAGVPATAGLGLPEGLLDSPKDLPEGEAPRNGEAEPADGGGSLATVARAAAMKAERALIEKTLTQVHWNRRKASQILGVSYKTLLNKIKECAITRD